MESTPHFPIYMDYSATNPCDERVVDAMVPWLRQHFGNPASRSHAWGWEAEAAVEQARGHVAALIGADPREIVWTSGATESNNLALKGAAHFYKTRGKHLITVKTEHKAVLDTMRELERQGFDVTYLDVQEDGLVNMDALKAAIRPDTILISILFVNNEIGVIQDIPAIGALCREKGILLHVDAAQATGRVEIDMNVLPIDLMSMTAHKTYGPKGVGALFVRRKPRVRLEAQMHGGGHERGMRSGTLPTHQIVGMGEAFRIAKEEMAESNAKARALQQRLLDGLRQYAGPQAQAPLRSRVAAVETLKDLLQQVESEPDKELSYEFSVARQGDDCEEGRDVSVPLDEAKITGRSRELLVALRAAGAEIEWPARLNGFKARFIIKAGTSQ